MHDNHAFARTVLVVSGGGLQGLALIDTLGAVPGLRLLVADVYPENLATFAAHGYFQAPPLAQSEAFERFLMELCDTEAIEAVFPATSFELDTLLALKPRLARLGVQVWVSEPAVLALNRDKLAFYEWLRGAGLPVLPATTQPDVALHAGSWIGKPRAGWGGRGVRHAASAGEAAAAPGSATRELVWQPCLSNFEEFSIDFAVNEAADVSPWQPRRRIRTLGGFAVLCEPSEDAAVSVAAEATIAALASLGARGMLNLQVLRDTDGCVWVSDLNARVGASMPMSVTMGVDPARWLIGAAQDAAAVARPAGEGIRRVVRLLSQRHLARPQLSQVRGVVFDLDDTLIDQKAWMLSKLELLWSGQAELLALPPRSQFLATMLQIIEEGNRASMFDAFAQQRGLPEDARQALIKGYRAQLPAVCAVYPDVAGTLLQLRRRGFAIGLLTDNPAPSQRNKLSRTHLESALDAVVLTSELGTSKPDPATFQAAASALGIPSSELVMVGDNMARDVAGALSAGFAHAFHVQRSGAFFNHAVQSWQRILPANWTQLNSLTELDWYLGEALH